MTQSQEFEKIRREYIQQAFREEDCSPDPVEQFKRWFDEATEKGLDLPNAMTLSTVSGDNQPTSRMVLLKEYDESGFVFFSNKKSQKAYELAENAKASLLFYWKPFDRQIRIDGAVEGVSESEAEEYFRSRPIDSQIAALASHQSQVIKSRATLEEAFEKIKKEYEKEGQLPMSPDWGGYRLKPQSFEFWQGRENRLHDRLLFVKEGDLWIRQRLAP
jgi:pyridoxamine-phosphate oxidase